MRLYGTAFFRAQDRLRQHERHPTPLPQNQLAGSRTEAQKLDKEWLKRSINHLVKDSLLTDDPQVEEQIASQFKVMMEN